MGKLDDFLKANPSIANHELLTDDQLMAIEGGDCTGSAPQCVSQAQITCTTQASVDCGSKGTNDKDIDVDIEGCVEKQKSGSGGSDGSIDSGGSGGSIDSDIRP